MNILNGVQTGSPEGYTHQVIDLQNDYVNGKLNISSPILYVTTNQNVDVDYANINTVGIAESVGSTSIYYVFNTSAYTVTFKLLGNTVFTVPAGGFQRAFVRIDDAQSPPTIYTP